MNICVFFEMILSLIYCNQGVIAKVSFEIQKKTHTHIQLYHVVLVSVNQQCKIPHLYLPPKGAKSRLSVKAFLIHQEDKMD